MVETSLSGTYFLLFINSPLIFNILMKMINFFFLILFAVSLSIAAQPAYARGRTHALGAGVRYHAKPFVAETLPYDDGDLSYMLAYEYHEGPAFWQVAVDAANDLTGQTGVNRIITPQINLISSQGIWQLGAGILRSYVNKEETGNEWTSVYWQLIAGVSIPFSKIQFDVNAYYVLDKWGDIGEFKASDLEFAGRLTYFF